MSLLQEHRSSYYYKCGICGKEIIGTANTIHLGIISHARKELRMGLRTEEGNMSYGGKPIDKNKKDVQCETSIDKCREIYQLKNKKE